MMPDSDFQLKPGFHTPRRSSAIGMYLFLASLFMLFAAGILGYVLIRIKASERLALGSLEIPHALWASTAIVVIASFTIQRAVNQLRHERQQSFRHFLLLTMLLAVVFVIVQAPSMVVLMQHQQQLRQKRLALYGLIFFLILLHALHVLGGIIALGWTSHHARQGAYDHEHYQPVGRVALYWHFLDAVWLVMFFTFLLVK
jgi:heme/copper-type cytochrome/quinol oxidase subunit 3